ncbi:MAG: site-specific DNA-methyltransferase [Patescibacteria group bacterium]
MSTKDYKNKIMQGDCLEVMKSFDDGSIDLVVTSPPYDGLRNYNGYFFDFKAVAKELFRVTKQGGVVVWVIGDATIDGSETGTSFKQALYFREIGFNLHDTMIFKKINPVPQIYRKRYNNQFEYMFVFSKGVVKTHNPIMVDCLHAGLQLNGTTYKNYSKNIQERGKMAKPVKDKKVKGNIWEYVVGKNKEDQEAKGHPAPFPCELAQDHILSWSNEGDLVLDPMCGSGTTCKMAKRLGRHYIGLDVSSDYCRIAEERLRMENNFNLWTVTLRDEPTTFFKPITLQKN